MYTIAGVRCNVVRMLKDRGDQSAKVHLRLLLFDAVQRTNRVVLVDVLVVQTVLQAVRLRHLAQQTLRQTLRQVVQVAGRLAGLTGRLVAAALTDHRRITSVTRRFAVRFR